MRRVSNQRVANTGAAHETQKRGTGEGTPLRGTLLCKIQGVVRKPASSRQCTARSAGSVLACLHGGADAGCQTARLARTGVRKIYRTHPREAHRRGLVHDVIVQGARANRHRGCPGYALRSTASIYKALRGWGLFRNTQSHRAGE